MPGKRMAAPAPAPLATSRTGAEPKWTVWEVILTPDTREDAPFTDALLSRKGDSIGSALRKIALLVGGGFPPAMGSIEYDKADADDPRIYVLKCKPSCWRLFFYVDQAQRRCVFLHAVCKRKWKRNNDDCIKARNRHTLIAEGSAAIRQFAIPDRRPI